METFDVDGFQRPGSETTPVGLDGEVMLGHVEVDFQAGTRLAREEQLTFETHLVFCRQIARVSEGHGDDAATRPGWRSNCAAPLEVTPLGTESAPGPSCWLPEPRLTGGSLG